MNNVLRILVSGILGYMLCSCNLGHKDYTSAVDLTEFMQMYHRAQKSNTVLDSITDAERDKLYKDSLASPLGNPQGLYTSCHWWTDITTDSEENSLLKNAAEYYNVFAFKNSICADCEIWDRAQQMEVPPMVSTDSIISSIKKANVSVFNDVRTKKEATKFRDETAYLMQHPEKWTDKRNPYYACYTYDSLVSVRMNKLVFNNDTTSANECINTVDTLIGRYMTFQKQVSKAEGSKQFDMILQKMTKAKTFDEQCAILLACSSKSSTCDMMWTSLLMRTLLESGRYSILLDRMLFLWRSFTQEEFCGLSRDSYIPNNAYDKVRREVYETIIGYSEQHPDDKYAIVTAVFLVNNRWLLRNGDFILGNDAPLEIWKYCPEFFEE